MGYLFDFDDMMQFDGDKLPDKFKMPQLQKFDRTRDPRIHLSQYMTTMSTTKAPMSVVARLFVLSLEGTTVNWYHGLEKDSFDTSSFVLYSYCFRKVKYNSFQSARIDFSNLWYQLTAVPSKANTNSLTTTNIGALLVLIVVMY